MSTTAITALVNGPSFAAFVAALLGCVWGECRLRRSAGAWRSDISDAAQVTRILAAYAPFAALIALGGAAFVALAAPY